MYLLFIYLHLTRPFRNCTGSHKSSVLRQKGESQNGCFKKTKHTKFSEKRTFLTPWYAHTRTCAYEGKKYSFFGKFGVLSFIETPVLRFALLPYYRQTKINFINFTAKKNRLFEQYLTKINIVHLQIPMYQIFANSDIGPDVFNGNCNNIKPKYPTRFSENNYFLPWTQRTYLKSEISFRAQNPWNKILQASMKSKNYFLILENERKGFLINHWNQQQYL